MKYLIKANHPVLKRVDITVDEGEVGAKVAELIRSSYEIESVESTQPSVQRTACTHPRSERTSNGFQYCPDCDEVF